MKKYQKTKQQYKKENKNKTKNIQKITQKKEAGGVPGADLLPNGLSVEGRQEEVHACRGADVFQGFIELWGL